MSIDKGMVLRSATISDLVLLRHWDAQPHIVTAKGNEDWRWETELKKDLDWREQLIAEIDARPVGFVEVLAPAREDSRYWAMPRRSLRHRYLDRIVW